MAEEFNTEGMLDMYLFENGQLLEQLEAATLEKKDEERFDDETINDFFRTMHTIKGSSGIMMYDNITEISHKLEDVFYYLRESHPENVPQMELVDFIFRVSDFISGEFEKIKNGDHPDGNPKKLIKEIDGFLEKIKTGIAASGEMMPEENTYIDPGRYYIAPVATAASRFYKIVIRYKKDTMMANLRAYSAVFALREIAEDMLYIPEDIISDENCCDVILSDGFRIHLQAQAAKADILELIDNSSEVEEISIEECTSEEYLLDLKRVQEEPMIDLDSDVDTIKKRAIEKEEQEKKNEPRPGDYVIESKKPGRPKVLAKQNREKKEKQQSFISVNVAKMDALMDLIGELVISESVVLQNPDLQVEGLNLTNFNKAARQLTKFTSELQDVIMSMRMMPLGNTFQKMKRIVFDTSRKLDKDIELEIIGEDTEVDKSIIEHISDPLMHLVRNAADHGVETKEDRIQAGKNPKGKIVLEAKSEGGKVFIIVKDDGKGMNPKKLYDKALESGIISDKKAMSDYTDKEIFQFVTYPGFSTKKEVSEISGRGVGMDVVVKNIQAIGGRLDIDAKEGEGSTFTLKIPLTLAIIEGIIMEVGKSTFVVETNAVKEFLSAKDAQIITEPDGEEYVVVREECYPVIRLADHYHMAEDSVVDKEKGVIIILEHEERKVCVFVDRLVGQQEIVVKPIPTYIKKVDGISGCTQLGDGSLALIIDVGGLLQ